MTDIAVVDRSGDTKGRTLIEAAYATLRNEIIDGTLEPGAKLRTEELRARYDVSGSTIREALTRLLGEALVTSEGQRGFRVAPASLDDFRDLTEVRKLIETEALRQAIAVGGEPWESEIVAAFYRLSKTEERLREDPAGASAEFEQRNRDFHRALIAACPSPWLHRLHALLYQQSERYRRLVASKRAIPRDVHAEHQGIFDATLARDSDLAVRLAGEHIERSVLALATLLAARDREAAAG
ncbi:GntR family transcriptional regulator [Roseiarcus fermentans]|uniref:GntR family transcriptional regulator n=1 Tax=Roseiarcus fermentans TaxID=1473586 RepID=A0A366EUE3_9HYPH|nr:FCD domain-containing protein [Roseiarcus fermentans]RBP05115.1 GntR family transcriptional regulator [Roseiarcus fermentans]